MPRKPKGIRPGDRVRIIEPEIFVRVGYPIHVGTEEERIEREHAKQIDELLRAVGVETRVEVDFLGSAPEGRSHVARALAYAYAKHKNFGGPERSLFTKREESLAGLVVTVNEVRFMKTGRRVAASGGYDWSGGFDYEPPSFTAMKTHRMLKFFRPVAVGRHMMDHYAYIEAVHVEKVEQDATSPL